MTHRSLPLVGPSFSPFHFIPPSRCTSLALTLSSLLSVARPPWVKEIENPEVLPRSLYPLLPPPQLYNARVQPITMSRCSSSSTMAADSVMGDAQLYADEDEVSPRRALSLLHLNL